MDGDHHHRRRQRTSSDQPSSAKAPHSAASLISHRTRSYSSHVSFIGYVPPSPSASPTRVSVSSSIKSSLSSAAPSSTASSLSSTSSSFTQWIWSQFHFSIMDAIQSLESSIHRNDFHSYVSLSSSVVENTKNLLTAVGIRLNKNGNASLNDCITDHHSITSANFEFSALSILQSKIMRALSELVLSAKTASTKEGDQDSNDKLSNTVLNMKDAVIKFVHVLKNSSVELNTSFIESTDFDLQNQYKQYEYMQHSVVMQLEDATCHITEIASRIIATIQDENISSTEKTLTSIIHDAKILLSQTPQFLNIYDFIPNEASIPDSSELKLFESDRSKFFESVKGLVIVTSSHTLPPLCDALNNTNLPKSERFSSILKAATCVITQVEQLLSSSVRLVESSCIKFNSLDLHSCSMFDSEFKRSSDDLSTSCTSTLKSDSSTLFRLSSCESSSKVQMCSTSVKEEYQSSCPSLEHSRTESDLSVAEKLNIVPILKTNSSMTTSNLNSSHHHSQGAEKSVTFSPAVFC